jgi:hypothetical protein
MKRSGMTPSVLTFLVVTLIVAASFAVIATQTRGGTGSTDTLSTSQSTSTTSTSLQHGLELRVSVNATEIHPGEGVQVRLSEFNTLQAVNNVSASRAWPVQVSLGSCMNVYVPPFGIAVYGGHVVEQNLSQGKRVPIYPIVPCPLFFRLVTGYEFQPLSDLAVVLPSSGSALTPLVGNVTVRMDYSFSQARPLSSGGYTIVAADEWGTLVFIYFTVV